MVLIYINIIELILCYWRSTGPSENLENIWCGVYDVVQRSATCIRTNKRNYSLAPECDGTRNFWQTIFPMPVLVFFFNIKIFRCQFWYHPKIPGNSPVLVLNFYGADTVYQYFFQYQILPAPNFTGTGTFLGTIFVWYLFRYFFSVPPKKTPGTWMSHAV